ncbi:hypothetical protein F4Z98_04965 [Candidatus Poribacteria bacterium]|nr:hypothetical protein [Candidatus Poribacteria bacterium]MYC39542.1 hypothetical protein [Candidatus Dadabacteria bacterium]
MPSNWNLADRIIDCFSDVIGFDETGDMDTLQKKLIAHTEAEVEWETVRYKGMFGSPDATGEEKRQLYEVDHDSLSKYLGFSTIAFEARLNDRDEVRAKNQVVNGIGFRGWASIWSHFRVEIDMGGTLWIPVSCRGSILTKPQRDLVEVALRKAG